MDGIGMGKKQIWNPYLPEYEYVPDGEPHVFGDRIYLYGSHDRFGGKKFCMNDYICYSAPVHALHDWRYEGVIYKKTQDPRMAGGDHELWAPDVVRGRDGRYYLYYCPDDTIRSIGVAVCDTPAGRYEFLGIVQDKNGEFVGERQGDTIQFDPGIFMDSDGKIYLYSGNGPRTGREIGKEPKASVVMQLEEDMLTIKTEPVKLLPVLGEADGTGFEGHEFFEASSIRKIENRYYLVYSSVKLHELCYAVSDYPDRGFSFGGVLISNCDIFEGSQDEAKNCYGNNHGGMEKIDGQWYLFYHRQTNRTMFSRQGCAEKIRILPDGSIPQVEMTSQGLNGMPLAGKGSYPAGMVCNLYGRYKPAISHPLAMGNRHPYLTQDGPDYVPEASCNKPVQYITNGKKGMTAVYRYFDFRDIREIEIVVRGIARGKMIVKISGEDEPAGETKVMPSRKWVKYRMAVRIPDGKAALYFVYEGCGKIDFLKFTLI